MPSMACVQYCEVYWFRPWRFLWSHGAQNLPSGSFLGLWWGGRASGEAAFLGFLDVLGGLGATGAAFLLTPVTVVVAGVAGVGAPMVLGLGAVFSVVVSYVGEKRCKLWCGKCY